MTNRNTLLQLLSIALTFALLDNTVVADGEQLKIFILAGQSNTVGHARAHTIATLYASDSPRDKRLLNMVIDNDDLNRSTLEAQLEHARKLDEVSGGISNSKVKALKDGPEKIAVEKQVAAMKDKHQAYKEMVSASCVVSDRVYINSIADRNKKAGKLAIGYGADPSKIGPEYGFGLSMAEKIDGPILLIKTSWGGKSLNYNFRPPSSDEYVLSEKEQASDKVEEIRANAGLNYRMMNEAIQQVLDNLKDNHPAYDEEAGYKIAGFVWFQGFNDQFSPDFRDSYEANMVNFIKDIRKHYDEPSMPFVIGVLGTGRTKEKVDENVVSLGQRAAAKSSEFKGRVTSVESYLDYSLYSHAVFEKGWPEHFHEWDTVGSDRPYHYLGSGAFFVRLGDSFAQAMQQCLSN
tara:strand:- start:719 stop:1933 length:1215 start_codon:yes stop_codon:yes gene_type:complete